MVKSIDKNLPPIQPIIRNCEFKFECKLSWHNLKEIVDSEDIRYCIKCDEKVYLIKDAHSLRLALQLNRCVALDEALLQRDEDSNRIRFIENRALTSRHILGALKPRPKKS